MKKDRSAYSSSPVSPFLFQAFAALSKDLQYIFIFSCMTGLNVLAALAVVAHLLQLFPQGQHSCTLLFSVLS